MKFCVLLKNSFLQRINLVLLLLSCLVGAADSIAAGMLCDPSQSACSDSKGVVQACCATNSGCIKDATGNVLGCGHSGTAVPCKDAPVGTVKCGLSALKQEVCCVAGNSCFVQTFTDGKSYPAGCIDTKVKCINASMQCGNECCNSTESCVAGKCQGGVCKAGETVCFGGTGVSCCSVGQTCQEKIVAGKTVGACVTSPTDNGRCKAPQYCCTAVGDCKQPQPGTSCCNQGTACLVGDKPVPVAQCCPPGWAPGLDSDGVAKCMQPDKCGATTCSSGTYCCDKAKGTCCPFTKPTSTTKTSSTTSKTTSSTKATSTSTSKATTTIKTTSVTLATTTTTLKGCGAPVGGSCSATGCTSAGSSGICSYNATTKACFCDVIKTTTTSLPAH